MSRPPQSPTWEGIYADFAQAGAERTVFEGTVWLEKVVARAQAALEPSVSGGAIPPAATTTDYALPFVAAIAGQQDRPLRILDFGGGMATSYLPLRAMLADDRLIDFVVVENDALSAKGKELFALDGGVTFRSDLPAPPERFDIAHFGSSLHYVDDWMGLLRKVTSLAPEYLLFVDLTAGDNRSFVTTQRFHDRRIPVHFWNVEEFVAAVHDLGFDLLLKARYRGYYLAQGAELPTSNFDRAHRLTYTSQLIFRRANR